MFDCALDQIERVADVIREIQKWLFHRFADEGVRCEVHDAVGAVRGECRIDHSAVFQIAEDEFSFGVDGAAMPLLEVIETTTESPARISSETTVLPI